MAYANVVAAAFSINPEPWAMGDVAVITAGKKRFPKVSPNKVLKMYQDALQEEVILTSLRDLPGPYYSVRFTFSRQLTKTKIASGRTLSRNWADVTNMQKGTEDALQGAAFGNDRDVIATASRLYGPQRENTLPFVVIEVRHSIEGFSPLETAICDHDSFFSPEGQEAWEAMIQSELGDQSIQNNEWTP
ncbi:hypothetical protein TIN4_45 [Tsukamurella phage TIN4]|uniref:Uncharacterized protein n=2 Tax=Tinduovirus TIN3 TaxID=1982571 RepID=A0A0K0N5S4_9CAUD|nr:RusA-like Holliday junction resolvase [Tsukamurella phage TIN3]YP_009604175.1 RusA-like Holliday junction resolvase [Tsukamurella phage TIN4]AKJ71842.1 hypothetical protein TIN3_45 [Tsukamurella phage TIN3]AKJ71951.1 hypothetical protein TIN4_45 [Tsukamurella phage TIN4]